MVPNDMRREPMSCWWRRGRIAITLVLLVAIIGACGGDSDDDDDTSSEPVPLYEGAEVLDRRDWTDAETNEFAAAVANGGASVAVTDASFEDVKTYYTDGVDDDGWASETSLDLDEDSAIAVVSNDDQLAAAYIVRGSLAKEGEFAFASGGLEVDASKIDDTDTVIAFSYFRCEEDDVEICLAALAIGS